MDLPRQKDYSCFDCKFYRPDETRNYQGNCCQPSPEAQSGIGPTEPGMEFAFIQIPSQCWCGDFEKWMGTPREKGFCDYLQPTTTLLTKSDQPSVEKTAAAVNAATKTAATKTAATKTAAAKTAAAKKTTTKKK